MDKVKSPDCFLSNLIYDTKRDDLIWVQLGNDFSVLIDIPKTHKYLKVDVNDICIKVEYFIGGKNKVRFDIITEQDDLREELIMQIRKQIRK